MLGSNAILILNSDRPATGITATVCVAVAHPDFIKSTKSVNTKRPPNTKAPL